MNYSIFFLCDFSIRVMMGDGSRVLLARSPGHMSYMGMMVILLFILSLWVITRSYLRARRCKPSSQYIVVRAAIFYHNSGWYKLVKT